MIVPVTAKLPVEVIAPQPIVVAVIARAVSAPSIPSMLVPIKSVDVIDVAPVTTPASTTIAPSRTICCPANGVIFKSVPAVEDMVFPFIVILSTDKVVKVPSEVIADCAACVTVNAVPLVLPVTSPVISPTKAVDVIDVAPVTTPEST